MRAMLCALSIATFVGCLPSGVQDGGTDTGSDVVDDSGAPDGGTDAASDAVEDTGGSCSLVGTWRGSLPGGAFAGQQITWTFSPGGTTTGTFGTAMLDGTWMVSGTTATVTDTASVPTYVACPATQQGAYTLTFSAGCAMVVWHATSDLCDGRRLAVDTLSVTRQ